MYAIYQITAPNGRIYVGLTKNKLKKRLSDHLHRAKTRVSPHPFYDCIRKYGGKGFSISCLAECEGEEQAKQIERHYIETLKSTDRAIGMNVSSGGEYDVHHGVQKLKELRSDPEWEKDYRDKLKEGVQKSFDSERGVKRRKRQSELSKKWCEENREEYIDVWKTNIEAAHRKLEEMKEDGSYVHPTFERGAEYRENMAKSTSELWQSEEYRDAVCRGVRASWESREFREGMLAKHGVQWSEDNIDAKFSELISKLRSETVAGWWSGRTEGEIRESAKKIAAAAEERWQNKSEDDKQKSLTQLAEARKSIDHEKRKLRQKEGLAKYWTPERRKEYGDRVRERNRKRKAEKDSTSL